MHLDGARAFNAAVASQSSLTHVCAPFDTVSVCFFKGLGAPAGTLLAGGPDFIQAAKRWRKMLGGGLRQSEILAAACLHALEHHVDRLAEDHQNAAWLASALGEIEELELISQSTIMVLLQSRDRDHKALSEFARERGVLVRGAYGKAMRLVTHLDVNRDDLVRVVSVFKSFYASSREAA